MCNHLLNLPTACRTNPQYAGAQSVAVHSIKTQPAACIVYWTPSSPSTSVTLITSTTFPMLTQLWMCEPGPLCMYVYVCVYLLIVYRACATFVCNLQKIQVGTWAAVPHYHCSIPLIHSSTSWLFHTTSMIFSPFQKNHIHTLKITRQQNAAQDSYIKLSQFCTFVNHLHRPQLKMKGSKMPMSQ